ncbi:MAG: hypothetical protein IKM15_06380 [Peptococcaceae bacterium]|nr:hypothetical protein [Peptococcaceae bacterium]
MSNKNNQANNAPKLSKKEKKELAEKQRLELKKKRSKYYYTSCAIALLAVLSYYLAPNIFPEEQHHLIHIIGYSIMGVAGFLMQQGSKYEDTEKRKKMSNLIGNILMVISFGIVISGIIYNLFG